MAIVANALVCLAVWVGFSARSTVDKIVAIVPPMIALVAFEFDHVVANTYSHVSALLIAITDPELLDVAAARGIPSLGVGEALANLGLVAAGNVVGGALLVAAVYWFVYLKGR